MCRIGHRCFRCVFRDSTPPLAVACDGVASQATPPIAAVMRSLDDGGAEMISEWLGSYYITRSSLFE